MRCILICLILLNLFLATTVSAKEGGSSETVKLQISSEIQPSLKVTPAPASTAAPSPTPSPSLSVMVKENHTADKDIKNNDKKNDSVTKPQEKAVVNNNPPAPNPAQNQVTVMQSVRSTNITADKPPQELTVPSLDLFLDRNLRGEFYKSSFLSARVTKTLLLTSLISVILGLSFILDARWKVLINRLRFKMRVGNLGRIINHLL